MSGRKPSKTEEQVNILMTKVLSDRFCRQESLDYDACVANFVIPRPDNSYVDQSLQRIGLRKCEPYKEVVEKCIGDEKRQTAVARKAASMPQCKEEHAALQKCHRLYPNDVAACERQTHELMLCGLVQMIQRYSAKGGAAAAAKEA